MEAENDERRKQRAHRTRLKNAEKEMNGWATPDSNTEKK